MFFRKFFYQQILFLAAFAAMNCWPFPHCVAEPSIVADGDELMQVRVSQFHMGMTVHLTVWAPTVEAGRSAAAKAFERIAALNMVFSDYEPASEVSRLSRQAGAGPVEVSDELWQVLSTAKRVAQASNGLYDPTVRPLSQVWRTARQAGKLPAKNHIARAVEVVGHENLRLDTEAQTVELLKPGMQLDLGGIAKGYVGDQGIQFLKELGYPRAAFEAGGDKVFGESPPGASGWRVEIPADEDYVLHLANCAVSLSGSTEQYLEVDGKRYSHVLDPRTGRGVTVHSLCLTIADRGLIADPLATLGTIMEREDYAAMLKEHFPKVEYKIVPTPKDQGRTMPRIPVPIDQ